MRLGAAFVEESGHL